MVLRGVATGRLTVVLVVVVASCLGCDGRGCHDNERRALLEIKKVFNPLNGSLMSHWGDSITEQVKDCCHWPGITCNPAPVTCDVEGTWHPNLTMLAEFGQLESLNLRDNQIGGGIPEAICHLKLLKTLDLSHNKFEGSIPSWLCTLKSLEKLDLSDNSLLGDIPSCFGSFHFLTSLDLSGNQFQWNDSSWLCNIHSLTYLSISNDRSPTTIPSCIGNLNMLGFLTLTGDWFKGSIPSSIFSNLTDLVFLEISSSRFEGTLQFSINTEYPISWVPSFQLIHLSIVDCVVNKRSGGRFPSFLKTQDLSHNGLSGSIPSEMVRLTFLETFSVAFNNMTGVIPNGIQFRSFNESMDGWNFSSN
ncbi:unnamed protein product [Spirodela intermedia]|uniref:Leucine-rich repeat-containing N-terminal plant-type domain-containing protein n=1 Tax=Spirodela intermedia TaxID=51605 RepID=A0A7I8JQU7_SPIIN|nr:unnamed protein product [Spirodela intermedia]CAA6672155.1 unnamed protein product [Spirodela intermedia]